MAPSPEATVEDKAPSFSLRELVVAVLVTTAIAIAARFVWVFPATYLPRWLSPSLRQRDPSPPWTWTFVIAFTGVRGVVSLAAALAIPLTVASGAAFPHRDLGKESAGQWAPVHLAPLPRTRRRRRVFRRRRVGDRR